MTLQDRLGNNRDYHVLIPFNRGFTAKYYDCSLNVLETALHEVGAYKSWCQLDPGEKYSVDVRYSALPALTKKDIREHFPLGLLPPNRDVNKGLASGEIEFVRTSGSTDVGVTNIWNQKWWDASEKASWKLNSDIAKIATGDHRECILVNPLNVGIPSDTVDLPMEKRCVSRFLYLTEKTDMLSWTSAHMDRMIKELEIYRPAVLEANPSYLAKLCRYITANGKTVFQPKIVVFTYEYPTSLHYKQIRRVFKVPLISSYGTTEVGYVFMQCERGKLHQNSEFCRVDFQPFKPEHGGPFLGRILVTTFNNPWYIIVRFDVGDLARLDDGDVCPCGRKSGLTLSAIEGRTSNVTLTCSGRLVTLRELDRALSCLEEIDEYQLIQLTSSSYCLHLVSRRDDRDRLREEAERSLRKLYGEDTEVSVVFENAIPTLPSGKYSLSQAQFPIKIDDYLDERYIFKRTTA